jgi:hypothetical protein
MPRSLFALPAIILLIAVQVWFAMRDGGAVLDGALSGTDPYMRLVRAGELLETGDWYDSTIRRSNAPFGETLHWTRPLDVLLAGGALALMPFLPARDALQWSATGLNPSLHLLCLLLIMWAVRPVVPWSSRFLVGLLFPLQLFLGYQFAIGRPDHHGLLILSFIWLIGATTRALVGDERANWGLRAAFPAALSIWIGVEGLVAYGVVLAALAMAWFSGRPDSAKRLRAFTSATAILLILALMIERPPVQWLVAEYDRLSFVHVVLAALVAAASFATHFKRRLLAIIAAVAAVAVMWLIYPAFFAGPLVQADPKFVKLLFSYAGEAAPLNEPHQFLLFAGPALLAVPVLLLGWPRSKHRDSLHALLFLLGLFVYLPLALWQARWSMYLPVLYLPAFADLLAGLLKIVAGQPNKRLKLVLRAPTASLLILVFAGGFPVASSLLRPDAPAAPRCAADPIARYLDRLGMETGRGMRVMSYMTLAPAILYRSRHEVIATPYHRNATAGLDTHAVFSARDAVDAKAIVDRRGVSHVLICVDDSETKIYLPNEAGVPALIDYLAIDTPPDWLRPLTLPGDLAVSYRLYEVVR